MTAVKKGIIAIGIVTFLMLWLAIETPPAADARPAYARDLPESLKNYCTVCHETAAGKGLNRFGLDYASRGHSIDAISALDSDGDGFTNGEELKAGTFPGDQQSHPGALAPGPSLAAILLIVAVSLVAVLLVWTLGSKIRRSKASGRLVTKKLGSKSGNWMCHFK